MTNAQEFNTEARAYCLWKDDKVVKECKECGGRGRIPFGPPRNFMWDVVYAQKPCPSCTPEADKWRKLADEFIWHEPIYAWCADNLKISMRLAAAMNNVGYNPPMFYRMNIDHGGIECSCGKSHMNRKFRSFNEPDRVLRDIGLHNPTYDNPADIANAFKRMGLWERFVDALMTKIISALVESLKPTDADDWVWINQQATQILARILLNPALFLEAGKNFLREVVGQS